MLFNKGQSLLNRLLSINQNRTGAVRRLDRTNRWIAYGSYLRKLTDALPGPPDY